MKALLVPVLVLVLVLDSCKDIGNDLPPSPVLLTPPPAPSGDSARFEFRLDGLRKTYSLDDTINAVLIAINKRSEKPLRFSAPGYPPEHWSLRRVGHSEFDYYYPIFIEYCMYVDSLRLGDTLSFKIRWTQEAFASNLRNWADEFQKAFAGDYELWAHLPFCDLFGDIAFRAPISIKEQGEELSCFLANMSFMNDTVDFGLAVRNRLSRVVEYFIDDSLPAKVSFSVGADTVLKRAYPLPSSVLTLQPFSDNMPFRFTRAERDTIFAGMRGRYTITISLKLRHLEICGSNWFGLYP